MAHDAGGNARDCASESGRRSRKGSEPETIPENGPRNRSGSQKPSSQNQLARKSPSRSHYLSSDNDPPFEFQRWRANLRVLAIDEIKTVPYVPLSHPFVERLIGTLRREFLDQVPFWRVADLTRKLAAFRDFYNQHRAHASLDGATPVMRAGQPASTPISLEAFGWQSHCRGLFQTPVAA